MPAPKSHRQSHLRNGDLDSGVLRLVQFPHAVLGGDVAELSVDPSAGVGSVPKCMVHARLKPQRLTCLDGHPFVGQPHGYGGGPHPLVDLH